jgi:hypothetical protein
MKFLRIGQFDVRLAEVAQIISEDISTLTRGVRLR